MSALPPAACLGSAGAQRSFLNLCGHGAVCPRVCSLCPHRGVSGAPPGAQEVATLSLEDLGGPCRISPHSLISGLHCLCTGVSRPAFWSAERPRHLPGVALESLLVGLVAFIVSIVAFQGLNPDVMGHGGMQSPQPLVGSVSSRSGPSTPAQL